MEDDRPTAAISVDADSRDIDEDDAAPDWRSLAALVQRFNKSNPHFIPSTSGSDAAETAAAGGPAFIPRKGEKDFEPVARTGKASKSKSKGKRAAAQYGVTDALHEDGQEAVSDEEDVEDEGSEDDDEDDAAILEAHQQRQLAESRAALFAALRAGGRRVHSSKMHNSFTWCPPGTLGSDGALSPHAGRAVCDDPKGTVYGIHFTSVGHNEHGKVTLLPEEALYLHERGAIELWRDYGPSENALGAAVDAKRKKVPMSVQQAWAELIGVDGLTLERYNSYAYLKRLGYILIRARTYAERHAERRAKEAAKDAAVARGQQTRRSLLGRIYEGLMRAWRGAVYSPLASALEMLLARRRAGTVDNGRVARLNKQLGLIGTRSTRRGEGTRRSLLSGTRWTTYDQMFSHLQIVPAGHDRPLPARLSHTSSPREDGVLAPSTLTPAGESEPVEPYEIFFYLYKPNAKFKKSAPPEPQFQLCVVDVKTTAMPDLWQFTSLFSAVPVPDDGGSAAQTVARSHAAAQQRQRSTFSSLLERVRSLGARIGKLVAGGETQSKADVAQPSSSGTARGGGRGARGGGRGGRCGGGRGGGAGVGAGRPLNISPYPALKLGRRNVLVATVDEGTTSFMRFAEAEFAKLAWSGSKRSS